MKDTTTENGSITLPKRLWQKLKEVKEEVGVPVSTQIRRAIEKELNK